MLTYELKTAMLLTAFFGLYALLMRRDTLFRQRRMALLASVILSAVLPLCHIEWHVEEIIPPGVAGILPTDTDDAAAQPATISSWNHYATIAGTCLLFMGMAVMAIRSIKELVSLQRLIRQHHSHKTADGSTIVVSNSPTRPFSYLNYIVMSEADFARNHDALIMHERAHIRHHHTIDLFLMNLMLMLQWFNPVAWRMRKELTMVHEYEADEDVLNAGVPSSDYLHLLISKATGKGQFAFANTLSERRMLKQRIQMLAKKRTSNWAKLKTIFLLPVIAVSLGLSAHVVKDYTYTAPRSVTAKNDAKDNAKPTKPIKSTESSTNPAEKNTAGDNSVEYKVNGIQVDKPTVEHLSTERIKQVTIIKNPISENDDDTNNDKPQKRTVYVDLNDTIIKKVDDDTYIMFDSQEDYDDFLKESNDISRDIEHARQEAVKAQKEAKKTANEAREAINKARAKHHREVERMRKDADKIRKNALHQADNARKYAERARQQANAYKENLKEKVIADEKEIIWQKDSEKENGGTRKQQDTLRLHAFNLTPADSTTIRLTVDNDGTVSNVTAYQTDSTSNGTSLMLICKKDGQDLIVLYKRI